MLFVVNGDLHADQIEDPDGQIVFAETNHNRGRQYTMSFVAEKAGVYQLRCKEHAEAAEVLMREASKGDAVMFKASRGIHLETCIEMLGKHDWR